MKNNTFVFLGTYNMKKQCFLDFRRLNSKKDWIGAFRMLVIGYPELNISFLDKYNKKVDKFFKKLTANGLTVRKFTTAPVECVKSTEFKFLFYNFNTGYYIKKIKVEGQISEDVPSEIKDFCRINNDNIIGYREKILLWTGDEIKKYYFIDKNLNLDLEGDTVEFTSNKSSKKL